MSEVTASNLATTTMWSTVSSYLSMVVSFLDLLYSDFVSPVIQKFKNLISEIITKYAPQSMDGLKKIWAYTESWRTQIAEISESVCLSVYSFVSQVCANPIAFSKTILANPGFFNFVCLFCAISLTLTVIYLFSSKNNIRNKPMFTLMGLNFMMLLYTLVQPLVLSAAESPSFKILNIAIAATEMKYVFAFIVLALYSKHCISLLASKEKKNEYVETLNTPVSNTPIRIRN